MTATMQSARGASAYTQTDSRTFRTGEVPSFMQSERDSTEQENWSTVIDELLGFRILEDDWNGDGTVAPKPGLVDRAITLAKWFQSIEAVIPNRVHVGVNSTIYMEWYTPILYQEVEVTSPIHAEFRSMDRSTGLTVVIELQ